MFYLHNKTGGYLDIKKRTLNEAINEAKKCSFPVQVSELIKNTHFRIKYAHVPKDKFSDIGGTSMHHAMLANNIYDNEIN